MYWFRRHFKMAIISLSKKSDFDFFSNDNCILNVYFLKIRFNYQTVALGFLEMTIISLFKKCNFEQIFQNDNGILKVGSFGNRTSQL